MAMNAPDAAALFFVADLPSAKISASRLGGILSRLAAGEPLTALQTEYLRNSGLNALADLTAGGISRDAFEAQAAEEQQERLRGRERSVPPHRPPQRLNFDAGMRRQSNGMPSCSPKQSGSEPGARSSMILAWDMSSRRISIVCDGSSTR